jgi:predicted dehydrogenase
MAITRRSVLAGGIGAGLAWAGGPLIRADQGQRQFRTALIGCGWWGGNILAEAMSSGRCKIVGLCDADGDNMEVTAEKVKDARGDEPKKIRDYREMLEAVKPEVVIVATPDHWHALQSVAAVAAGAHVFVEKPTGHTVRESRAIVNAARRSDRVVQVGLHRRIGPHHVSGMQFLREGKAGRIGMVRMFAHSGGTDEKPTPNSPPPETLDWDLYCGPAPMRPFNRRIHPGGFRNYLDFANGILGDWGTHWLDQLLWWSEEKHPRRIHSTGGRHIRGPAVLNDQEQTSDSPDTQVATYEFESFTAVWEHRRYAANNAEKHGIGAYFHGTKGTFHMGWRDGWTFYPADAKQPIVHQDAQLQQPDGHNMTLLWADFMKAIDSRSRPVADIELGHRSSTLAMLGMLSLKAGRSIQWDGEKEQIIGDDAANQLLGRAYRGPWQYPVA